MSDLLFVDHFFVLDFECVLYASVYVFTEVHLAKSSRANIIENLIIMQDKRIIPYDNRLILILELFIQLLLQVSEIGCSIPRLFREIIFVEIFFL